MSEDHDGGYTDSVRVPADMVMPIPRGTGRAAGDGAGHGGDHTVLDRLKLNGLQPQSEPIAVTGATGGGKASR